MKRIFLLLMAMVLLSACTALAKTPYQAKTYNLGGELDRVKLRDRPATGGKVLGQYFGGVIVRVLDEKDDWCHVIIGGREGFMMREFLTAEIGEYDASCEGIPGAVTYPGEDGTLPLHREPDETSDILARVGIIPLLHVLATINDAWLHVRYEDEKGNAIYGYVSGQNVTYADNLNSFVIDTGDAGQLLQLKALPSAASDTLGQYFSGTRVSALFDNHVNGDGWEKVRIGDAVGYMASKSLDHSTGGTQNFYPPLSYALQAMLPLFKGFEDTEAFDSLSQNVVFSVLGIHGERYFIRIETDEPFDYRYGYVRRNDVQSVARSASAIGSLISEQELYYLNGEGNVEPSGLTAKAGAKVYINGSVSEDLRSTFSNYIDPNALWLDCEVEMAAYNHAVAIVPRDAVSYDKDLEYHPAHR